MRFLCVNSALLLVVVLVSVAQVRGSRCYECVSSIDMDCKNNPQQDKFSRNCNFMGDHSEARCLKRTFRVNDQLVTKRECASGYANSCSQIRNSNSGYDNRGESCDECTGDLCNSSPKAQTISVIMGLSSMALFAFLK